MANSFGTDILIQAPDPKTAASFYVKHLGFEITGETPQMISSTARTLISSLNEARHWVLGYVPGTETFTARHEATH